MSIYNICETQDLLTASSRRFADRLNTACHEFRQFSRSDISKNHFDAIFDLLPCAVDTPELRSWVQRVERFCDHDSRDANLSELAANNPTFDQPRIERVLELMVWEFLGAAIQPTERTITVGSTPPALWFVGKTGIVSTQQASEEAASTLLSSGVNFPPTLQSPDGRKLISSCSHHASTEGEFRCSVPITNHILSAPSGLDFPLVRSVSYSMAWVAQLENAAGAIDAYSSSAFEWIKCLVTSALPLASPTGTVGSATREDVLGLIFLPATDQFDQLVECLLHETMHQLLHRIEECGTLFENDTGEERYYSPWRSDPRPLRMVLHGAFVFSAVADLYAKSKPESLQLNMNVHIDRAYLRSQQAVAALKIVKKYAHLTDFGQVIVEATEQMLNALMLDLPARSQRCAIDDALSQHRHDYAHYMS